TEIRLVDMDTAMTALRLPRSAPETQGIPSQALQRFVQEADANLNSLHSVMLLRHGAVVAEGWWSPYAADIPHMLYSLSKSFTSSAVGLAVEEGLLTVDDSVLTFFPDEAPAEVSENLAAMRVRHLLSMNTGHAEDSTEHLRDSEGSNWVSNFLAQPVPYKPGTHFFYDSGASYMLSAIVQKLTGQPIVEYLGPRLFEPLGIHQPFWETCPRGINTGGWGLYLTTEDIACFGQMLLQKGVWNGQRILPESWVETASTAHSDNSMNDQIDWQQGYGYQFWRCRHNAFRGDGAFGQFCVVMPDQDAVLAVTAGVADMQAVLNLVWKDLLPSMGAAPVPEDIEATDQLRAQLASLALPPAADAGPQTLERTLNDKEYVFEPQADGMQSFAVRFENGTCHLLVRDEQGEHDVVCGRGAWNSGITTMGMGVPMRVAASSGWLNDHTLAVDLCMYETPHIMTLTCRFDGDSVSVDKRLNVSFAREAEAPPQVGHAA
ncbi:MAG: serine hydrolase domain-containing protein, partial [Caldilineaceae bacterium]